MIPNRVQQKAHGMAIEIPPDVPNIFVAASTNNVKALEIAVPYYGINAQDEFLMTALHHASSSLAFEAVDFLMAQPGIDPTIVDKFDRTASYIPLEVHGQLEGALRMSERLGPHCYSDMEEDRPQLIVIPGGKPPKIPGPGGS